MEMLIELLALTGVVTLAAFLDALHPPRLARGFRLRGAPPPPRDRKSLARIAAFAGRRRSMLRVRARRTAPARRAA
ncbi:MAG: hypothetical protein AB7Q97_01095 [Gammaproteobacteria bacterium]